MQRDYFKRKRLTNRQLCQELVCHCSTAVRSYKRPSSNLVKAVSNALQPPSEELEEPEGKI